GHGLTRFPYDHLFLPEKHVIARGNRRYKHNHTNIHDFGINKLKITDYLQAIHRSGLKIIFLEFNQSSKLIIRILKHSLARIPFLRNFLIINMYFILEKE
ncbi:MAG: hypothetical protein PHS31_04085, partial [Victivallaceae bacterium]|nr:hypothetical protein [Victivallaceae bacterium]